MQTEVPALDFERISVDYGIEFPARHFFEASNGNRLMLEIAPYALPGRDSVGIGIASPMEDESYLVRRSYTTAHSGPLFHTMSFMRNIGGLMEAIEIKGYRGETGLESQLRNKTHAIPDKMPHMVELEDDIISNEEIKSTFIRLSNDAAIIANSPNTKLDMNPYKALFDVSWPW